MREADVGALARVLWESDPNHTTEWRRAPKPHTDRCESMAHAASGVWGWAMRLWMDANRARREGRPVPEYRMPRPESTWRFGKKEGGERG